MPLRIEVRQHSTENTLALEGWLKGPEVEELERLAAWIKPPFRIDLVQLAGADADGVTALQALIERGAVLANASPYIELLLRAHAKTPFECRDDDW